MNKLLAHIATLIGQENLLADAASLAAYAGAASFDGPASPDLPLAVARPRHPAQLARMLAFCTAEKIPLAIRGAGTRPVARTPLAGKLLLVTTGLDRIYEINPQNRSIRLQAGVSCRALQAALAAKSLFCPAESFGTVGGSLAVNPAACQTLKYGSLSSFVSNLRIALADGQTLNASLYGDGPGNFACQLPLAGLMCGSRGQLGVIAACSLRLLPAPEAGIRLAFKFASPGEAAQAANILLASPLEPSFLEIYDGLCAAALGLGSQPLLIAGFEGRGNVVRAAREACASLLDAPGEPADFAPESLLPGLRKARGPFRLVQAACPPERLGSLLAQIRDPASGLELAVHCDAAVALARIAIFGAHPDIASFEKRLFAAELMLNEALETEADASLSRQEWQSRHDSGLLASLKTLLDPAGILNPLPDSGRNEA
ncbi:MAG: FAD-binding oxidoreductase [Desulfovibrio sp.]|nr:FAD-binding oxidoreductase [Desulfovibrio sp.]